MTKVSTSCGELSMVKPLEPSLALPTAVGLDGVLMSISCTPLSSLLATMVYVLLPITKTSTPQAPASAVKPLEPSLALPTAVGLDGILTSISCTPSSSEETTIAYVLLPMTKVLTAFAPSSSVNPLAPSTAVLTAVGLDGVLTSIS